MSLAIIGCGNPNRSDDGAGPAVIDRLHRESLPAGVTLYDAGTDGMAVLYRARGLSHLIIVDARAPEDAPGAVYEVPGDLLQAPPPQSLNLHDFRWDHALYAGQRIYGADFPKFVKVLLIEASTLELGLTLSTPVEAAVDKVVQDVKAQAKRYGEGLWQ